MSGKERCGRIKPGAGILLVLVAFAGTSRAKYSGGTGEPNDPYRIATAEDLNDIGNHVEDYNKCFVMVADVNLAAYTGTQFNMIGTKMADTGTPFSGMFDGNGHAVLNFSYVGSEEYAVGLFGYVGFDGQVRSLILEDVNVASDYWDSAVGTLVGYNEGKVWDCRAMGAVRGTNSSGGLVGYNRYGVISHCYVSVNTCGIEDFTGGLSGGGEM